LTARAMAFSDQLFTWTYHLVKKWGYFILYKMFSEQEESWLDSYVMQRKMTMIRKHYYKLYEEDIQRVIYIIKKP
jgi:16S rRNA G527 N7-methylase RsmG